MYDAFFEDRSTHPCRDIMPRSPIEDLEQDMVGPVGHIYEAIGLNGYAQLEPKLKTYVATQKNYQKNKHAELEIGLRRRIPAAWEVAFDEFGYPA